jgi:hypothetical protein
MNMTVDRMTRVRDQGCIKASTRQVMLVVRY